MSENWFHELSGLIATSRTESPAGHCVVRVRCGTFVKGVDLTTGTIVSHEDTTSELSGDEATLTSLIRGEITLQAAFRSGAVRLAGDPEPFLRLAIILDRVRAAQAEAPL